MNAKRPRLSPAALPLLILASCAPWGAGFGATGAQELRVALPPAPAAWAFLPDLRMELSWRGPDGGRRSARAAPGSSVLVEVARGFPQAVFARPSSSGRALLPAGALYPEALAAEGPGEGFEELRLDWRGGYAASLAAALEGGGVDPSGFDVYALVDGAVARAGDPWLHPALEVARRLAEGDFRIDLFGEPERFPVDLPGPGPWAPESPFAPAPEGSTARLPEGLWRFLGEEAELLVSVDSAGRAAFVRR
jgi:hypothetical protein